LNAINLYAVLAATLSSFIFGALWYSPLLCLSRWCKETGVHMNDNITNPAKVYGITFALTFVSAFVLSLFLGASPVLSEAMVSGAILGAGVVAASMGINYQFANSSFVHWIIDAGFHILRFSIMGLVFGLWASFA